MKSFGDRDTSKERLSAGWCTWHKARWWCHCLPRQSPQWPLECQDDTGKRWKRNGSSRTSLTQFFQQWGTNAPPVIHCPGSCSSGHWSNVRRTDLSATSILSGCRQRIRPWLEIKTNKQDVKSYWTLLAVIDNARSCRVAVQIIRAVTQKPDKLHGEVEYRVEFSGGHRARYRDNRTSNSTWSQHCIQSYIETPLCGKSNYGWQRLPWVGKVSTGAQEEVAVG